MLLHFVIGINFHTAFFLDTSSLVQCPVIPDYNSVTTLRMCVLSSLFRLIRPGYTPFSSPCQSVVSSVTVLQTWMSIN